MLIELDETQLKIVDRMKVASASRAQMAVQGDRLVIRNPAALEFDRWKK